MAHKKLNLHLRIDEPTALYLEDLTQWLKLSVSEIVRRAIFEFWEKHRK